MAYLSPVTDETAAAGFYVRKNAIHAVRRAQSVFSFILASAGLKSLRGLDILPEEGGPTGIKLFCSYSHRDEPIRNELAKHLKLLERQGLVRSWDDRQIGAGDLWKQEIDRNLQEADIILLLISADFLASDYCFDIEMKTALERHMVGDALVIPVILRPVDWQATPFGAIQALPRDGKPVTTFENLDVALQHVAAGIRAAIEKLLNTRRGEVVVRPSAAPLPAVTPRSPLLPSGCLERIAGLLSLHIGPIAGVVVRQAAVSCRGPLELCEVVATEIADPRDRNRFLKDAYTADRAGWPTLPTGAKPSAG